MDCLAQGRIVTHYLWTTRPLREEISAENGLLFKGHRLAVSLRNCASWNPLNLS